MELVPQAELDRIDQWISKIKEADAALLVLAKTTSTTKLPQPGTTSTGGGRPSSRPAPDAQVTAQEKELNRLYDERARLMTRLTAEVQKQAQANSVLKESQRQSNAEAKISAKELLATANSVDALRAKIPQLAKAWASLDMDSPEFKQVGKDLAELRAKVTQAEMSVGQFGRNVGNYASGLSPLNFQVQQLAREMPSLAHSIPQFFLAISNNLPMFADEMTRAKTAFNEYKDAVAKGVDAPKVVSPMKQVLSSVLSWQTALVIGITLLTMYSGKIVDWAKSLFTGRGAALSTADAVKKVNDAMEFSDFGQKIANFKRLSELYAEIGDNAKAKERFLKDYREELDETGISIKNVNDADNLFIRNSTAFVAALKLRAQMTAAEGLASEEYGKALKEEVANQNEMNKLLARRGELQSKPSDYTERRITGSGTSSSGSVQTYTANIPLQELLKENAAEITALNKKRDALNTTGDAYNNLALLRAKAYADTLKDAGLTEIETGSGGTTTREPRDKVNLSALNREREATEDITAAEFERDKAVQRSIIDSDSAYKSTMDRYAATQKLYELEISEVEKLAEAQKNNLIARNIDENTTRDKKGNVVSTIDETKAAENVANQIYAVELVKTNKINALREQAANELRDLDNEVVENAIRNASREVQARQRAIDQSESDELAALSTKYSGALASQEDYEKERLAITRKHADERQLAELAALKEQLAIMEADPYIDASEQQKIIDLRQDIADAEVEINKTKNERIIEDNETAREKQIETLGRIKDAFGELLDFIGEVSSLQTQKRLDDLDAQQEAAEKQAEDEQARIERLAEAGAITEEQKNARIALSNQQLEEKQKQIDKQRAEAEKKQAQLDVAIKTAQAIMVAAASAPWPWNLIPIGFVVATGAVQLAAIDAARYAEGTPEGGHRGGLAWVGDGGRSEMVIMGGKAYKSPAVPTLIDLPKGAEVLPDYNQAIRDFAIANAIQPIRQADVSSGRGSVAYNDTMVLARLADANRKSHQIHEELTRTRKVIEHQGSDRRFKEFKNHMNVIS